jgi:hypothetical protein
MIIVMIYENYRQYILYSKLLYTTVVFVEILSHKFVDKVMKQFNNIYRSKFKKLHY